VKCVYEDSTAIISRAVYILNTIDIREKKESHTLKTEYQCIILQWSSKITI